MVGWINTRFLPTSLYARLKPDKLNQYVEEGLVASAKLVQIEYNPAILFQDQLNLVWSQERRTIPAEG